MLQPYLAPVEPILGGKDAGFLGGDAQIHGMAVPARPTTADISALPLPVGSDFPVLALGIRYVPLSGDPRIDGVLDGGRAWASTTITYAFPDSPGDYTYPYGVFDEPFEYGFGQVSSTQRRAVTAILEGTQGSGVTGYGSVEAITPLNLVYAGYNNGDLRIAQTGVPFAPAWTYRLTSVPEGGDTWFYYGPEFSARSPMLGDYAYFAHLHELPHALGLKDGSVSGPILPYEWDSLEFSIVSYRSFVGSPLDGYRNEWFGFPQTLMMLDIAALQHLYGADFTTQSGDTVYRWSPTTGEMSVNGAAQGIPGANRIFLTIWDGGGTDTYDLSNYATPASIDLAPGGWSVTAAAQRAVLNNYDGYVLARGNVFNALQYQGDPRSLIENAVGGSAGDMLNGNAAANRLEGQGGDDTLVGGVGADTLIGGEGFDVTDYGAEGGSQGVGINLLSLSLADFVFAIDSFGTFDLMTGIEGVIGTGFADVMYGTNEANRFIGAGGADQVVAWGGADTVDGGAGDDVMLGWTGNDSLIGGTENDYLWAGDGNDTGLGGDGVDVLVGDLPGGSEVGADSLAGGLGEDILLGGAADDTLVGGADSTAGSDPGARDWLVGGAGNDLMFGGGGGDVIWEQLDAVEGGADTAFGGDGNDLALTGTGNDSLNGGTGNDTLYGGMGADTIATGEGADLIWFTALAEMGDVLADFASGQDRMVVYPLLGGAVTTAQAFAQGVLALEASGPDTLLRYDADGAGLGAPVTVATFLARAPGSFSTASDFI